MMILSRRDALRERTSPVRFSLRFRWEESKNRLPSMNGGVTMKGEVPIPVLANYFRVPQSGGLPVDYPGRDLLLQARIANISKNGVYIVTQHPQPLGAEFPVTFQLPDSDEQITAECVVRWSTRSRPRESKPGHSGMGLEFVRLSKKDRRNVERFVRDFLTHMRARSVASNDSSTVEEFASEPPVLPINRNRLPPQSSSARRRAEPPPLASAPPAHSQRPERSIQSDLDELVADFTE